MIFDLKLYGIIGAAALAAVAFTSCGVYKHKANGLSLALDTQNAAIKQQKKDAADLLDTLRKERDDLQQALDSAAIASKERQRDFETTLAQLRARADQPGPVRVRIVPGSCRESGGSAALVVPGSPGRSDQPEAAASGFLSAANSRRLERELIGIEELSRDFNACQDSLLARMAAERRR